MTRALKQFNFTEEQVAKLCKMQDELNTYIHPEWKTQGFNWNLAIIDECMEIHGHLGWKWWKVGYKSGLTEANKKQVQLEVIDILHFVLSNWIQFGAEVARLLQEFNTVLSTDPNLEFELQDLMADCTSGNFSDSLPDWAWLAHAVDLTEQEILETYTQKYVLNKFRQDHGYKDGSYIKEWLLPISSHNGASGLKEDNEVLSYVVNKLALVGRDTTDEEVLYNQLKFFYTCRLN